MKKVESRLYCVLLCRNEEGEVYIGVPNSKERAFNIEEALSICEDTYKGYRILDNEGKEICTNWLIHPGALLKEEMETRKLTKKELAELLKISFSEVKNIFNGTSDITQDIADKLEELWKTPASFWMRLQKEYFIKRLKNLIEPIKK